MKEIAGILGLIFGSLAIGIFIFWYIPLKIGEWFGSLSKLKDRDGNTHYKWGTAAQAELVLSELSIFKNMIILIILSTVLLWYSFGG